MSINPNFIKTFGVKKRCYSYNKRVLLRKFLLTALYPLIFVVPSLWIRGKAAAFVRFFAGCKNPATHLVTWSDGQAGAIYCDEHTQQYIEEGHGQWTVWGEKYKVEKLDE